MGAAVLILCNKNDLEGALSADEISRVLTLSYSTTST